MKENLTRLVLGTLRSLACGVRRCWLPLCLAAVWAGCQPQAQVAADPGIAGTYTLISVDGRNVPCAVKHDGHELTVKSGTFVIGSDGTCSSKIAFNVQAGQETGREVKATYKQSGSKLTMKWEGAGTTIGTVDGNNFAMENEGMKLAYRR